MSTPETLETLKSRLGALPGRDRAELAQFLIDSLDPGEPEDVGAAWEAELARRVDDIESGRVVGKPAEQVFAELRARFP